MKSLYEDALNFRKRFNPNILSPNWFALLEQAACFSINASIIRLAKKLREQTDSVDRVQSFIKLPFPVVFIEWPTPFFEVQEGDFLPRRSGALLLDSAKCISFIASRAGINVHLAESLAPKLEKPGQIICLPVVDLESKEVPPLPGGFLLNTNALATDLKTAECELITNPALLFDPLKYGISLQQMAHDCQDEAFYLPWILTLLNCPNLTEIKIAPKLGTPKAINSSHQISTGRKYTLAVKLSRVQQRRSGEATSIGSRVALHTVRGHFKIRKTGIFWWSDHWAGDISKGKIEKSYTFDA